MLWYFNIVYNKSIIILTATVYTGGGLRIIIHTAEIIPALRGLSGNC